MRLPVRTLVAITGLAGAATVALGYLTFTTAVSQRRDVVAVDRANVGAITAHLVDYGLINGRWDGVQPIVDGMAADADTRIVLTTASGATLAHTGASPGPPDGRPIRVDPGPQLLVKNGQQIDGPAITLVEIRDFRRGAALAACMSSAGIEVAKRAGPNGVPRMGAKAGTAEEAIQRAVAQCPAATASPDDLLADAEAVRRCVEPATSRVGAECLGRVFSERTAAVTAEPVLLYLGDRGAGVVPPVTPRSGLLAAIMIFAATGTGFAGRALYLEFVGASRRLVEGADDQVAEMSRYVDEMATSLRQKEEAQRERIAAVAHELRNPLANIRAYLEGLSDGVIQPQPELFASLHDEAMLQQRIIDDLRGDSARADSPSVDMVELDLAELVTSACAAQRPAAQRADIRLMLDVGDPLPVIGDPDRLRQVLGNLLSNALRYTPAGGAVQVRTSQEDGRASVQVIDTGIGIAEGDLPRVFDRQWRSVEARSLVADGSGLGLAITRQFVIDHSGAIFVDSRPGVGTAFTVVLPLAPSAVPHRAAGEPVSGARGSGQTGAGS